MLVVDISPRTGEACVGDLMGLEAQAVGLAGLVVGACTGTPSTSGRSGCWCSASAPSRPAHCASTPALGRADLGSGGLWTVDAGDVALVDEDGALLCRVDRVGEVFDLAESIRDAERRQADRSEPGSCALRLASGHIWPPAPRIQR
ncbi:hypothetical protein ABZ783_28855 [Micromonospora sp. NPDC047738]|uniref:hypothetical protein n=1 Tax=Micromonospora sp. NPDC047738 TaxID=3155741 RepID=UPI0033E2F65B